MFQYRVPTAFVEGEEEAALSAQHSACFFFSKSTPTLRRRERVGQGCRSEKRERHGAGGTEGERDRQTDDRPTSSSPIGSLFVFFC